MEGNLLIELIPTVGKKVLSNEITAANEMVANVAYNAADVNFTNDKNMI